MIHHGDRAGGEMWSASGAVLKGKADSPADETDMASCKEERS